MMCRMEITSLLSRVHRGDSDALNTLIPLVYEELKRLAASHLRREYSNATLQTTALVHEAFLRLSGSRLPECENRSHFYGIASRAMRQILIDMARSRHAVKRDGQNIPITESLKLMAPNDAAFLRLNDALDGLAAASELKGRLIELHYFGGLTAEESAELLQMPVHTVRREIRLAQAWLRRELSAQETLS
jgi:RNA polymerase sigma factor (TIGR02999 family)